MDRDRERVSSGARLLLTVSICTTCQPHFPHTNSHMHTVDSWVPTQPKTLALETQWLREFLDHGTADAFDLLGTGCPDAVGRKCWHKRIKHEHDGSLYQCAASPGFAFTLSFRFLDVKAAASIPTVYAFCIWIVFAWCLIINRTDGVSWLKGN